MNPKRSSRQKALHTASLLFISALLLFVLAPYKLARATQPGDWADSIAELIASSDYVEGEAIVALLGGEADALTAQAGLPVDSLEPLMGVSAEAAGVPADVDPGLTAQAERGVTLTLVKSDTLTTEEILRALAGDPLVAFAEPNYTFELAESEDDLAAVSEELAPDVVVLDEAPVPNEDSSAGEDLAPIDELPLADDSASTAELTTEDDLALSEEPTTADEPVLVEEPTAADELEAAETAENVPQSTSESAPPHYRFSSRWRGCGPQAAPVGQLGYVFRRHQVLRCRGERLH